MFNYKHTIKSQPYLTEGTVAGALPGTDYQINVLILYALKSIKNGKPFELRTESTNCGKFDDIWLYHEDNLEVVQIKHSQVNEIKLNYLAANAKISKRSAKSTKIPTAKPTGANELDLWMYFDSWFDYKDC